ncbi:MAG: zinc transporter ZntB [Kangiellaceae bacterium]
MAAEEKANVQDGLVYGYYLNGENKGVEIRSDQLPENLDSADSMWLHFNYRHQMTQDWIRKQEVLGDFVVNALLDEETRPRASIMRNGVLISLRGVNLNPGADPEDMIAIRLWSDGKHIISTRSRSSLSARDIANLVCAKEGPETPGEFIALLTELLISRMDDTIQSIEDQVAEIEETILETESYTLRSVIANLRRQAISLRRYLAPQREAMLQLQNEKISWFTASDRIHLRETNDRLTRYIEDIDSARDRAAVTQEELVNRLSEQLNSRMYVLSIVAAIFLPLGFLTGLLGINVGGIPGADNPYAFAIFAIALVAIVALQIWIFKVKRWF